MSNILKSAGALVISCFVMLDVNAMFNTEIFSENGTNGDNCSSTMTITKYPDPKGVVKAINVKVCYNGETKGINNIIVYFPSIKSPSTDGSMVNISMALEKAFPHMPGDIRTSLIKKGYEDLKSFFLSIHYFGS